jgi:hypothetical protein
MLEDSLGKIAPPRMGFIETMWGLQFLSSIESGEMKAKRQISEHKK